MVAVINTGSGTALALSVGNQQLISAAPDGTPGNGYSAANQPLYASADARYVVFASQATNLTSDVLPPNTTPSWGPYTQTYLYDRQQHHMELVSRAADGTILSGSTIPLGVSDDARFVLLSHTTFGGNLPAGVHLLDRQQGSTTSLPVYYATSFAPIMSGDGNIIVYAPSNSNVAIYNRITGSTVTISNGSNPIVSHNGRYVFYNDYDIANNGLAYRYDMTDGSTMQIPNVGFSLRTTADGSKIFYVAPVPSSDPGYNQTLVSRDLVTGQQQTVFDVTDSLPAGASFPTLWLFPGPSGDGSVLEINTRYAVNNAFTREGWVVNTATGDKVSLGLSNPAPTVAFNTSGTQMVYSFYNKEGDHLNQVYSADISGAVADTTAPVLSPLSWSINPKTTAQTSTLTVPATDNVAVTGGEYYLGDTDPGQGNGTPMTWNGTALVADFSQADPGVYKVTVRARDAAGNWSQTATDYLVTYDPAIQIGMTGTVNGNKKGLVPSLDNGDTLPGLTSSTQTDVANYGFTVDYLNSSLDPNNDFTFSYQTGSKCKSPKAENCHSFSLTATHFDWLIIDQAGNSRGRAQGTATVTIDGITTTNPFTLEVVDGDRMSPAQEDHVLLKVYATDANPTTASSLYQASGYVGKDQSVRIR
jgi:hypothetical protein